MVWLGCIGTAHSDAENGLVTMKYDKEEEVSSGLYPSPIENTFVFIH